MAWGAIFTISTLYLHLLHVAGRGRQVLRYSLASEMFVSGPRCHSAAVPASAPGSQQPASQF